MQPGEAPGTTTEMERRTRGDALDRLEYEDNVLHRLMGSIRDEVRDRRVHGEVVKLFVERMAVRQAAREMVADGLRRRPDLAATRKELEDSSVEGRRRLGLLDEMTRGVQPTNVNHAQDVDGTVAEMAPALRALLRSGDPRSRNRAQIQQLIRIRATVPWAEERTCSRSHS